MVRRFDFQIGTSGKKNERFFSLDEFNIIYKCCAFIWFTRVQIECIPQRGLRNDR